MKRPACVLISGGLGLVMSGGGKLTLLQPGVLPGRVKSSGVRQGKMKKGIVFDRSMGGKRVKGE